MMWRRLVVVCAIFGAVACSGLDQDQGPTECDQQVDCRDGFCGEPGVITCEREGGGADTYEIRCMACSGGCDEDPICGTDRCQPAETCDDFAADELAGSCSVTSQPGALFCYECLKDGHCSGQQVCTADNE